MAAGSRSPWPSDARAGPCQTAFAYAVSCGAPVSSAPSTAGVNARTMILPLALAQFIASYAATNMNVAISAIAKDLGTTVAGVQTAITLFTLTMAALMIPGSKLTDIWGRKRCFVAGLVVYGAGGLLAALSMGLPLLIVGYSLLEGMGSALMIPPIYILVTVAFPDVKSRARYFGVVSGAGGLGAAAGPLIGGLVTSAISWRASFGLQVLVVAWIIFLARGITDPARPGPRPRFDLTGAVLSAAGLFFVVLGTSPVPDVRGRRVTAGLLHREHGGDTEGLHFPGVAVRGHRRAVPAVVLPARPVVGAQGQGRAAAAADVPQQGRQPGDGHPGHPVARSCRAPSSWSPSTCRRSTTTTRSRPA